MKNDKRNEQAWLCQLSWIGLALFALLSVWVPEIVGLIIVLAVLRIETYIDLAEGNAGDCKGQDE